MKFFLQHHWGKIITLIVAVFIFPYLFIFLQTADKINTSAYDTSEKTVAIVLGAAVYGTTVSDVFGDRIRRAARLWEEGKVQKILISGDNREIDYNEPKQGKKFLLSLGIPPEDIVLDYAGRRTYDTCWRAKYIFGVEKAYIVTQGFHLPRSVFTCSQMGIDSRGVSATLQDYQGDIKNFFRESLALQKAFYEVLFFPHKATITGNPEPIFTSSPSLEKSVKVDKDLGN